MVIDAKEGKRLMDELGQKLLILDVRHAFEFNRRFGYSHARQSYSGR